MFWNNKSGISEADGADDRVAARIGCMRSVGGVTAAFQTEMREDILLIYAGGKSEGISLMTLVLKLI